MNNEDGADCYYFDHFKDSQLASNTLRQILDSHRQNVHRILSNDTLTTSPSKIKKEFLEGSEVTARPAFSAQNEDHTYPPNTTRNRSRSASLTVEIPSWIKSGSLKLGKAVYSAPRMIPHPHLSTILPKFPSIPFLNSSNSNSNQQRQQSLPNPTLTNTLMRTNSKVCETYEEPSSKSGDRSRSRSNSGVTESDDEFEEVGSDFSVLEHSAGMEDVLRVEEEVQQKFNDYFALSGERILGHFNCALFRVYPVPGKVYITNNYLCFRSFQILSKTKVG